MAMHIKLGDLLDAAAGLTSDAGENPEYDRALVELVSDVMGLQEEQRDVVRRAIGVKANG